MTLPLNELSCFSIYNNCGHDFNILKTRMSWYIESFLPNSQSLTTLDLRRCLVNFESIKKIVLTCVELREANFSQTLSGFSEEETDFFVNNLTPKIEKLNLESACLKNEDVIALVTRCQSITELDLVLNPIDAGFTVNDDWEYVGWEGLQISLAAIAYYLSESLTKIQLPWQIFASGLAEFINLMPKLKYLWHFYDHDPRNFVNYVPKDPFGNPIGDKEPLRRECPQVYINEGSPQIACCTNKPSQRFWDLECAAIDLFPEKSESSQKDDRSEAGPI